MTIIKDNFSVKFTKRSESEPIRSTVDEELGMMGKLKLSREVGEDAIESLRDDYEEE